MSGGYVNNEPQNTFLPPIQQEGAGKPTGQSPGDRFGVDALNKLAKTRHVNVCLRGIADPRECVFCTFRL